jgi:hypothetical protein
MPKWSPLVKGELHTAQEKQCTWKTRSRALITSSEEMIVAWQRAHLFIPNSLKNNKNKQTNRD